MNPALGQHSPKRNIIPNYRLPKHDLEVYLGEIFPSWWVEVEEAEDYYVVPLPRELSKEERSDIRRSLRLAEERYYTRDSLDSSRSSRSSRSST